VRVSRCSGATANAIFRSFTSAIFLTRARTSNCLTNKAERAESIALDEAGREASRPRAS
jgi:hypothetical protein